MQPRWLDKLHLRHRDGSMPVQASRGRQAVRSMYGWLLGLAWGSRMRPLRLRPDRGAQLFLPRGRGPVLLQAGRGWDALRHVSARILRILLERLPSVRSVRTSGPHLRPGHRSLRVPDPDLRRALRPMQARLLGFGGGGWVQAVRVHPRLHETPLRPPGTMPLQDRLRGA